jgi:hypothetical protein
MLVEELKEHGSWAGETHVQKAAFLLQVGAGVPLGYNFTLYKHGPFAFDLRNDLLALRADGVLDIEPQPEPYGPSIVTTSRTPLLQAHYPKTLDRYGRKVRKVAELIGHKGVVSLERLATAYLLITEHPEMDDVEVAAALRRVKPHISPEGAAEAVSTVRMTLEPFFTMIES